MDRSVEEGRQTDRAGEFIRELFQSFLHVCDLSLSLFSMPWEMHIVWGFLRWVPGMEGR